MSNSHNICVCGRERGKGPVIISISTCKHKNPANGAGSVCVTAPPKVTDKKSTAAPSRPPTAAPSRPVPVTDDRRTPPVTPEDAGSGRSVGSGKRSVASGRRSVGSGRISFASGTDDEEEGPKDDEGIAADTKGGGGTEKHEEEGSVGSAYLQLQKKDQDLPQLEETPIAEATEKEAISQDETPIAEATEKEAISQDETPKYETPPEPIADDAAPEELQNEQQQNETDEPTEETEDKTDDNTNEVPIMMLRETAINTMPFLQNLFRFRQGTKSVPSFVKEQEDENSDCTVEIFIFEKHVKDCRRIKKLKVLNENSFLDGDSWVESIGRISFPTCTDEFQSNQSSVTNLASRLQNRSESERNLSHYKRVLRMLEAYLKNQRNYETLSNRGPFDLKFQKYITMGDDPDSGSSKTNVKELYVSKVKNDKSVQFVGIYNDDKEQDTKNPRKWYEGFLICLGIRHPKDVHDIGDLDHQLGRESSYLMTKYLRI